jgi:hypothetical protein
MGYTKYRRGRSVGILRSRTKDHGVVYEVHTRIQDYSTLYTVVYKTTALYTLSLLTFQHNKTIRAHSAMKGINLTHFRIKEQKSNEQGEWMK